MTGLCILIAAIILDNALEKAAKIIAAGWAVRDKQESTTSF